MSSTSSDDNKKFGFIIVFGAAVLLYLVLWACDAITSGGGDTNPDDYYSDCSSFTGSLGIDYDAKCIDDSGDVVKYRDTSDGAYLNYGR